MSGTPAANQVHFRIRTDTNTPAGGTPTWAAAQDTAINLAVETTFRIRFCVQNTGTAQASSPHVIRVSKNGGAYTAVTTSTGATLGAQSDSGASTVADETGFSSAFYLLTAGAGSAALGGMYDESGSAGVSVNTGNFTEIEYGLILKTAGAANGDTFDFRLYSSTTAFTTYSQTPRVTVGSGIPNDALLANDVGSGSSVTQPAITQVHNISANDIVSPSSVTQPAAVVRRDILANDVSSGSSVSVPTAASIVPPVACLANDVVSASSVTQPSVQQRQALLANDVLSASSVSQPAAIIRRDVLANDVLSASSVTKPTQLRQSHTFLANDVLSGSSVTHPAAIVGKTILANDVISASSVGQPAVHAVHALAANDVLSASSVGVPAMLLPGQIEADDVVAASSVTTPTLHQAQVLDAVNVVSASSVTTPVTVIRRDILANDIVSASSVSQPAVHLSYGLLANDIVSGSSVSHPALAEIAPSEHALLANDVTSASSVSNPDIDIIGEGFSPDDIAGLNAWVDASQLALSDGAAVSSWPNLASGGATSIINSPAMVFKHGLSPNGTLPVVRFTAGQGALRSGWSGSNVHNWTLLYVVRRWGTGIGRAFSVMYPPSNLLVGFHGLRPDVMYDNGTWIYGPESTWSGSPPDAWKIYEADSNSGDGTRFYIDGALIGSAGGSGGLTNGWGLSGFEYSVNETMDCDVCELVLYDRRLTDDERIQVEGYLREKWFITAVNANDVTSASFVSTPALVVEGEVIPVPPEVGGGGKVYGRGFPRKRWEELLRRLEAERQEALERAETFTRKKAKAKARKAARAASEAIAAAREAADEAAVIAHAGDITRMLEGAAQATSLAEYLRQMELARMAAIEWEDEDDVETVLMMVA